MKLLNNPFADYVPTLLPGHPIASSLANLLIFLLAMIFLTFVPNRAFLVLRILLPGSVVLYFGPLFLLRTAYVTANVGRVSPDLALYSLVNLSGSIILIVLSFGFILREAGLRQSNDLPGHSAIQPISRLNAIYFSFVTWTTVGFGDIVPDTTKAKILVMVESVFGFLMFGLLATQLPVLVSLVATRYFQSDL